MRMIGRYRIGAAIGEGAMAQVFLAHDPSIERTIAIKILRPELRGDPEVVQRFLKESRAAGMLSHAHIATIYDVGQFDGIPYIAMEHVDGEPLDTMLAHQGRLTTERVLALSVQIADALDFAHRHGVIHRDIKPSNILISDKGRSAKLLDFGIARIEILGEARAEREVCRTVVGQIMGTPRYMSPEQAMGLPVDHRSDLFSLGSVIYEMTVGKPAFPANGLASLAIQIAQGSPIPIEQAVTDCPRGLRFVIAKLLAKKPADRFTTAAAVRDVLALELEAMQQDRDVRRRGIAMRTKLSLTMAVTAAVALGLSVGFVLDRQKSALEAMALTSASSMTSFVARNVGVRMAENAGLPVAEQDWLPVQAFAETAAAQGNVHLLTVADEGGVIRAADNKALIGKRYVANGASDAAVVGDNGFRITRAVRYAGHNFGRVDMIIGRGALDGAMRTAEILLFALSLFVVLVVAAVGYFSARQLSAPLRRLNKALTDVAGGNTAFRISHRRRDEIGSLFDTFNDLVEHIEMTRNPDATGDDPTSDATRIIVAPTPSLKCRVA
jgi:serine/threonine protein kinase/HAMP domain-containing protein